MTRPPDFYNDLALSLKAAQQLLLDGASNRQAAAHHPVIASVDDDGLPHQRVMILRQLDWPSRQLRLHTDLRSDKVKQFEKDGPVSVLIYDEVQKLQLRMSGTAYIASNEVTDTAWSSSTAFARRCYMAEQPPGATSVRPTSGLPDWIEGKQPNEDQLINARRNFAAVIITVNMIEWLYLANAGHRRARWYWSASERDWLGTWLIP